MLALIVDQILHTVMLCLVLFQSRDLVRHARRFHNLCHVLIAILMLIPEVEFLSINLHRKPIVAPFRDSLAVAVRHLPAFNKHFHSRSNSGDWCKIFFRKGQPLCIVE